MRLQIEKPVYGGSSLAHTSEGQTILVPFTLPGEVVEAGVQPIVGEGGSDLLHILEPSADRVTPGCRHFGACGGCQYQHAAYPAQLRMKRDILVETLARVGLTRLPTVTQHEAEPWHYRNRIRLRVEMDQGELRFGYSRRASNAFLAISECPIAAPLLWRAAETLLTVSHEDATTAAWLRASAEVELACTNDTSRLQITFLLHSARSARFAAMCDGLHHRLPELTGAGAALDRPDGARTTEAATWGVDGLPMQAAGKQYWVPRGGFFQVNRTLAGELVRLAVEGRSGQLAWDLFAGVGLFSRALRGGFEAVTAVEASSTAAAALRRAAIPGVRTVAAPVLPFLRQAALERDRPELIVLDPPRAGVGVEGARLLAGMGAREVVYVSCDPTTLARDLRAMVDSRYDLAELHLVDMFPQTFHLETVALLQRA